MITQKEAQQAYDELVYFRRQNPLNQKDYPLGSTELHHIVPTSCEGKDIPENLIRLLAKEHFMAHVYLWVIHHDDKFHQQTLSALMMMQKGTVRGTRSLIREFILASEEYQKAREEFAAYASQTMGSKVRGKKNGQFGKHWYSCDAEQMSKLFNPNEVPDNNWTRGYRYQNRSREKTIKIQMRKANNIELEKRKNDCRIAFFTMYYEYYLKHGFSATCAKYDLVIERTALLHMFKKYVAAYESYNRWKS